MSERQQNKEYYLSLRKQGKTDDEILNTVPKHMGKRFLKHIKMDEFEIHFGISQAQFIALIFVSSGIVSVITMLLILNIYK